MAFAIGTIGTSNGADNSNCTITKPTSLAVGDVMIVHIIFYGDGAPSGITVTAPDDWVQVEITPIGGGGMYTGYKIADSDDVAASDFAFSASGVSGNASNIGRIFRLNGSRENSIGGIKAEANGSGTTITVGTITPSVASSLILFFTGVGGSTSATSGYAMATDNPSWTELYDVSYNGTTDCAIAMAYAERTQTTGTGNNTATISSGVWAGTVLAVEPQQVISVNESLTLTDVKSMGLSIVKSESVSATDVATATDATRWVNTDKTSTTWVNRDK